VIESRRVEVADYYRGAVFEQELCSGKANARRTTCDFLAGGAHSD
jgi:hypothetical protein